MSERFPGDTDPWARVGGMVIFLVGLVLLLLVFFWAYGMFAALGNEMATRGLGMEQVGLVAVRVLLLFVMGYLASLVATKGIQLYGVGRGIGTTK